METDALLSVEEAAKRLGGISKWTVHAWLSQGKLRRTKVGARTMIRESELMRVIREEDGPTEPKAKAVTKGDQREKRGRSGGPVKDPEQTPNGRRQRPTDENPAGNRSQTK
jgi:excisionase family DNA binding protein